MYSLLNPWNQRFLGFFRNLKKNLKKMLDNLFRECYRIRKF